jgi:choline-sulfatase
MTEHLVPWTARLFALSVGRYSASSPRIRTRISSDRNPDSRCAYPGHQGLGLYNIRRACRNATALAVLLLVPFAAVCAADKPNVVFIMTDQQFADAMSCRMGKEFIKTPAMDSLAQNGVLFTRAYTTNPLCMPARNAIFTGRYPHETGVTKNANAKYDFPDTGTYFKKAGYQTAYFGKRHLCFKVEDSFPITNGGQHDVPTTELATEFLSRKHELPFLLVVSFMNPHNVCELARGQKLPDGPIGEAPPTDQCPPVPANLAPQLNEPDTMTIMRKGYHASPTFPVGTFTPDQWRQLRWGYYRLIEKVDAQIGTVLAALRKAGLEENTLVVFTSDHGECAGAHGFNQKTVLYEESVRVPLIVSLKGRTKAGTCDKLVNTGIDLLPTLLEFAGAAVPKELSGRSLRPLVLGEPVNEWRDHIVVEDHMDQAASIGPFRPAAEGRMVLSVRYKYCVYSRGEQRESLVDLESDPGETKNLAGDPAFRKVLIEHRALLTRFGKEQNDPLVAELLSDDVKPIPFTPQGASERKEGGKKKGK